MKKVKLFLGVWGICFLLYLSKDNVMNIAAQQNTQQSRQQNTQQNNNRLLFDRTYSSVGDTLTLQNQPKDFKATWTITSQKTGMTKTVTNTNKYTILEEDRESLISVEADGYEKSCIYISDIPVIYIESDTGYRLVTKGGYTNCTFICGGCEETKGASSYEGAAQIKLRGNSTVNRPKCPFKVKLDKKADLYGMGASKHWVLLANDIDHSLLRNKLLYDFSRDIGTETYMESRLVSLIYNGEYEGVYQLAEHVRVSKERVNIYNWENKAEDIAKIIGEKEKQDKGFQEGMEKALLQDFKWIDKKEITYHSRTYAFSDYGIEVKDATGGFLLEMDFYSRNNISLATLQTAYEQPIYFNTPSLEEGNVKGFLDSGLYQYANSYVQSFEYALHSMDFIFRNEDIHYRKKSNPGGWGNGGFRQDEYQQVDYIDKEAQGLHYSQMFDMDSLVANFLFCEYAMNWDSMKNSFFLYKDIDELGKLGPQWDFDWAWGNINMFGINTWYPQSWHTTEDDFTVEQYYQTVQWNRMLIRDPYFLLRAYEKYKQIRPTIIEDMISKGGLIDQYEEMLKNAGEANDRRWSYTYKNGAYYPGGYSENFKDSVNSIRRFLTTRIAWMDEQMETLETFMTSLGYYKTSDKLSVVSADTDKEQGYTYITAQVEDSTVSKVMFQVNGVYEQTAEVEQGQAIAKIPDFALTEDKNQKNIVEIKGMDKNNQYKIALEKKGNYQLAHSNYMVFEKENLHINKKEEASYYEDMQSKNEQSADKAEKEVQEKMRASFIKKVIIAVGIILLVAGAAVIIYKKKRV